MMKKIIFAILALACFSAASGQTEQIWQHKVTPALLQKTAGGHSTPFLILLPQQADVSSARRLTTKEEKANYVFTSLRNLAGTTQENLISFLKQNHAPCQPLFIVNAIRTEGTLDLINSLAQRSDVKRILDDQPQRLSEPFGMSNDDEHSRSTIEWGINMINADDVWAMGFRGQGVTVGGEDTGYEWAHAALKNQYRGYDQVADTVDHNYNWHDAIHKISPLSADSINPCGLNSQVPCDDNGHGTHTMGTMIGLDGDNEIGVAPEAKWCGCRNMERGWGAPYTYLECFQWFLAPTDLNNENPDPAKSPHVINNSWYCSEAEGCDSSNWQILNIAVNNLRLAGTVVVVSAGNAGSGCSSVAYAAGMFEGSFTIGATAVNDTIAGFSSRGPVTADGSNRLKPNVSAPGVNVRSARLGGGYVSFSGTSMAGPHVVGLVALMISANPDLAGNVEAIEDIIEQTAIPKTTDQNCGDIPGSQIPNNTYGFGRVDALAAVEAALALIPVSTKQDQLRPGIMVYPNPVNNQLIISIEQAVGEVYLQLFDAGGRMMLQRQWNGGNHSFMNVDVQDLPSGIYFYRIMTNGGMQQGKIVKNQIR